MHKLTKQENGDGLTEGQQDDNCGWEAQGLEGLHKKEKGLMDKDNSVVIAAAVGYKGTKW